MSKPPTVISIVVGIIGVILFTTLLATAKIGEASYVVLLGVLVLACIAILALPRLRELDIRSLKLTLDRIEAVKAGIEELYGGIEHLRKAPLVLDKVRIESLGLRSGHITTGDGGMRYTVGCIKRERERLARFFCECQITREDRGGHLRQPDGRPRFQMEWSRSVAGPAANLRRGAQVGVGRSGERLAKRC